MVAVGAQAGTREADEMAMNPFPAGCTVGSKFRFYAAREAATFATVAGPITVPVGEARSFVLTDKGWQVVET